MSCAGLGGLVYARVQDGGALDAAKAVKEGLSPEQQAALVAACEAEPGATSPPLRKAYVTLSIVCTVVVCAALRVHMLCWPSAAVGQH